MIALDSSFIISFFHENDIFHNEAVERFRSLEKEGQTMLVTNYVINEAVTVMIRKQNLAKSKEFLEFLLDYKMVEVFHIDRDGFMEVIEIFKKQEGDLSFTDCSLMWLHDLYGFKVETSDKKLLSELEKVKAAKHSRR